MSEVIDLVMRLHDGVTSVLSGINSQMATTANMQIGKVEICKI